MTFLTVRHVTTYRYNKKVTFGEHRVMFRPRDSYDQRLTHASLTISPEPRSLHWTHDVFGNCVACARFDAQADNLRFESLIELDHAPVQMLDFTIAEHAETYPFTYDQEDLPDLLRSIERQYPDRNNELHAWAHTFVRTLTTQGPVRTADLLAAITKAIRRDFTYVRREEMGIQPPLETLRQRSGSCRDFALLMMEALRALGFAARFVSGYLYLRPSAEGQKLEHHPTNRDHPSDKDARLTEKPRACSDPLRSEQALGGGSTHAWVQVYIPGAGWLEFDPTNGVAGSRDLIRVAIARDPAQAVPLWGTYTGYPADSLGLTVEVSVSASPHSRFQPPPTNT